MIDERKRLGKPRTETLTNRKENAFGEEEKKEEREN